MSFDAETPALEQAGNQAPGPVKVTVILKGGTVTSWPMPYANALDAVTKIRWAQNQKGAAGTLEGVGWLSVHISDIVAAAITA